MSDVLELANRLRNLSDDDLAGLLRERALNPTHLRDFFDLAEAMLQTKNAEAWLSSLNLDELKAISSRATNDHSPFAEIASLVFHSAASQRADFGERFYRFLSATDQDGFSQEAADGQAASHSAGSLDQAAIRVFETCQALTEIVYDLEHHRVKAVGKSGVASVEIKRLALHLSNSPEQVKHIFEVAHYCDLVTLEGDRWALTKNSANWIEWSTIERWRHLANFWLLLAGKNGVALFKRHWDEIEHRSFSSFLTSVYPLGAKEEDSRSQRLIRFAEAIGLIHNDRATRLFEAVIDQQFGAAEKVLQLHLPKTQDRIIIQADLSIVTPGPLGSVDERELRQFVETEQIGIASRMRLTPLSLTTALESGLTMEQVRATLLRLSQGVLPQPVEYLLNDTAKRYGRIRISVDSYSGWTKIDCADELLTTEIFHNSALRPFALEIVEPRVLRTKYDSDVVYFGLREVGLLAIRVDDTGKVIAPMKTASGHQHGALDTIKSTIERLRIADAKVIESGDDESMLRQIQLAIKNRASIQVSYRGQEGKEYEFVLEPIGLANGRLRGKDRRADIERTLTLANITKLSLV